MSELVKTGIYVGGAFVLAVFAYLVQPKQASTSDVQRQVVIDNFDPGKATHLVIVKSSELGSIDTFEVRKDPTTDAWSIVSQEMYPADAEEQMKTVATLLVDLQIVGVASDVAEEHEMYGVVDPSAQDSDASTKGLGTLLKMSDADNNLLADLIIGKQSDQGSDYRFVRRMNEDRTYVVKINPEKLTTKFEDWIEQDLLKLNAIDVEDMSLLDYAIVRTQQGAALQARAEIDVKWDSKAGKWQLNQLRTFNEQGTPKVVAPSPLEELDQSKLDEMKRALDDLKIAGVSKKPEGLSADLKVSGAVKNDDAARELQGRGFYVGPGGRILGANGEVHIVMKDGVEYTLHFGSTAGLEVGKKKEGEKGLAKTKLNRFLMVRCSFNESKFPEPVKEQLKPPAGAKADQPPVPNSKKGGKKKGGKKKDQIELDAEKARIEKEYQKKVDERKENIEKAKKRVAELNNRFAKWYYIVSEDVYKKVHLNRETILTETANAKDQGFGIDAFRSLEKGGIKGSSSSDSTGPGAGGPPRGPGGRGGFPGGLPGLGR